MNLIFCLSNLHVPITLSILSESDIFYIVYTNQFTIYRFLSELSLQNMEVMYEEKCTNSVRSRIQLVFQKRYSILKRLKNLSCKRIYFFNWCYGTLEMWFIHKLSKECEVIFAPTVVVEKMQSKTSFRSCLHCLYEKIVWNVNRDVVYSGGTRYAISDTFIKQNNIHLERILIRKNTKVLEKIQKQIIKNKDVVILVDDVVALKNVNALSYYNILNKIIYRIGSENVLLKCHPRYPVDVRKHIFEKCDELPSYIPMNVVIENFSVVIGVWSTLLVEAVNCGVQAISLMNILESEYKKEMYDCHLQYLKDNDKNSAIKYPHSIEELIAML